METIAYQIQFHDFWCTTSGLSGGAKADILTIKDSNGLPYIPGRTLKGLLREAAETLHVSNIVEAEWIKVFFGEQEAKENDEYKEKHRKREEGIAFFANATFNKETAKVIIEGKVENMLFEALASTAIDSGNGIAKTHSLRRTEVVVPCTLYANVMIEISSVVPYDIISCKEQLEYCMKYIKKLGHHRTRGLGRCTISTLQS